MDKDNINSGEVEPLFMLYEKISNELISDMRKNNLNPNDVALETGITSEYMLNLLVTPTNGDYLAYKSIDTSVKKLSKKKVDRKPLEW